MNFAKDYDKEKESLLSQLRDCLDEDQALEINRKIVQLNREKKQAQEERANNVAKLFNDLKQYEVDFNELMASRVYSPEVVMNYLEQNNISSPKKATSKGTSKQEDKESKKLLTVGTFNLADYGFEAPNSNETEFTWQWNKRYGPSWQSKFIRAIAEKGYEHVLDKATPEFKAWLMEYKEGQKRAAGKKIFENKREFLKTFGMKPADADKIELNFEIPEETYTRLADEHSQQHPDDNQDQGNKKKGKKATA